MFPELISALEETLMMVFSAGMLTFLLGLPMGILLSMTAAKRFWPHAWLHNGLTLLMTASYAIPYLLLMLTILSLVRYVFETIVDDTLIILALALTALPNFTCLCERAVSSLPKGLIDAAQTLGATLFQIIYKVLLPEALPALVQGGVTTLIHLIGYSAIAGALGAGGLGRLAIHKGYYGLQTEYLGATVILFFILVQVIRACGQYIVHGTVRQWHPQPSV